MLESLDLTPAERLAVIRKYRLRLSQKGMAEHLGISEGKYRSYERDETVRWRQGPPDKLPELEGDLGPEEVIFTLRTRLGWTLDDAAAAMGRSRATYVAIENGGRTTARWSEYVISLMEKELATAT